MKKLLPLIIIILGLAGGIGVGVVMKPEPEPITDEEKAEKEVEKPIERDFVATDSEYVELSRKLIVPTEGADGVKSLIAIELHIEVAPGFADHATAHEPKVRDAFLRTLLWFSSTGAFGENAHQNETFEELGEELTRAARKVLGDEVRGVLIGDMIKQDI